MPSCSHCKASVTLSVITCPNCGLDFDAFSAGQVRKANFWMAGGFACIMAIFASISVFKFLLGPLILLGITVQSYCAFKSIAERRKKPVVFIS